MALASLKSRVVTVIISAVAGSLAATAGATAQGLPPIRATARNAVPSCVTPDRLMAFVGERNPRLNPKFDRIAEAYRDLGQAWQVRWDYAFFQMVLETNYLQFRRGDGSSGDVSLAQNNFAGVGATGGGVPGDRFPDVRTGVLAHIQHLVAYSGDRVDGPVAERTRLYQGDIIEISRKLGRPVTFSDLSHRWAVDRAYGRNIEVVADLYRKIHCGTSTAALVPMRPVQGMASRALPQPNRLGAPIQGSDSAAPPAPVEVQRKPKSLVTTIWRREGEEKTVQPVPPKPIEARRPQSGVAQPAAAAGVAGTPPTVSLRETLSPESPANIAGFAQSAQAAAGARLPVEASRPCRVAAGEGEDGRMLLVRSRVGGEDHFTPINAGVGGNAATVAGLLAERMPGAEIVGIYDGYERALVAAHQYCPRG